LREFTVEDDGFEWMKAVLVDLIWEDGSGEICRIGYSLI